jgi:hypothetical protein
MAPSVWLVLICQKPSQQVCLIAKDCISSPDEENSPVKKRRLLSYSPIVGQDLA